MRCLITGCSGLIGPELAIRLRRNGDEVWGTYLSSGPPADSDNRGISWVRCDVSKAHDVQRVLKEARPDRIFHLAAQSYPVKSWSDPLTTIEANLVGTLNLLDAVRLSSSSSRVLVFGSSAEYGSAPAQADQISENAFLQPDSPYGVSKTAADMLADVYTRAYRLDVIRVRPFLVIGPGRGSNVFIDFARRITDLENVGGDSLGVGNLSAVRDIVDVRDAVDAIAVIADKGSAGEVYNLCTGKGHSIGEALEIMLKLCTKPVRTYSDAARFRPLDTPRLVGDGSKLRQLGWEPRIALEQTLADILNYWRAAARSSVASGPV